LSRPAVIRRRRLAREAIHAAGRWDASNRPRVASPQMLILAAIPVAPAGTLANLALTVIPWRAEFQLRRPGRPRRHDAKSTHDFALWVLMAPATG
jgi:hypothetical protein